MSHFLWFGLCVSHPCNCFLLLVWWWSRLDKEWLETFGQSPSDWKVISVKWQETFFLFFRPAFFSKPSKLLASLVPILIVPVSYNWCRVTNRNNQIASWCLCGTWRLNIHNHAVKTFTSFQIHNRTFLSSRKRHLIHLGIQLVHLLQYS